MRHDNSKRTAMVARYNIAFLVSAALFVVSAIWLIAGYGKYATLTARSSTPIGTSMTFQRSSAPVTLKALYTDTNRDVLIARISGDSDALLNLPYKGSDYAVFIASDGTNSYAGQDMPILFGRYSTNGDFFLIIPKPSDDIYNVFIQNTNFVANDLVADAISDSGTYSSGSISTDSTEQTAEQLTDALNSYLYSDSVTHADTITIQSNALDVIGFRITLAPALSSDSYRVQVIDADLLSDDGTFDFEQFFNKVFKESATAGVDTDYENVSNKIAQLEERQKTLQEQYAANTSDTNVKEKLESVKSDIASLKEQLVALSDKYTAAEGIQYSPSLFTNMQTSARVVSTSEASSVSASSNS